MKNKNYITLKDAYLKIGDLVNKAQLNAQETIITKMGKPAAKVIGLTETEKLEFSKRTERGEIK